jgi:hypothetical protein
MTLAPQSNAKSIERLANGNASSSLRTNGRLDHNECAQSDGVRAEEVRRARKHLERHSLVELREDFVIRDFQSIAISNVGAEES